MKKGKIRCDLMLGLPCYDGKFEPEMLKGMSESIKVAMGKGYTLAQSYSSGSNICKMRAKAASSALETEATWLLFIDADTVFPRNGTAILDMIETMKRREIHILSGMYVGKQPPYSPIAYMTTPEGTTEIREFPDSGLMEVDSVGAGLLMIDTEVLRKVQRPWFKMDEVEGEDQYFCNKARAAGYKVWLDCALRLGHVGRYIYTVDDHVGFMSAELAGTAKEAIDAVKKENPLIQVVK